MCLDQMCTTEETQETNRMCHRPQPPFSSPHANAHCKADEEIVNKGRGTHLSAILALLHDLLNYQSCHIPVALPSLQPISPRTSLSTFFLFSFCRHFVSLCLCLLLSPSLSPPHPHHHCHSIPSIIIVPFPPTDHARKSSSNHLNTNRVKINPGREFVLFLGAVSPLELPTIKKFFFLKKPVYFCFFILSSVSYFKNDDYINHNRKKKIFVCCSFFSTFSSFSFLFFSFLFLLFSSLSSLLLFFFSFLSLLSSSSPPPFSSSSSRLLRLLQALWLALLTLRCGWRGSGRNREQASLSRVVVAVLLGGGKFKTRTRTRGRGKGREAENTGEEEEEEEEEEEKGIERTRVRGERSKTR